MSGQKEHKGCPSGHKGAIGYPSLSIPYWVKDIIDFRNERYRRDLEENKNYEEVDEEYDRLDRAINALLNYA